MVSLLVPSPEVSNFYVGVYPELPSGLDPANMLEVRSGYDARAYNGYIFVWEGESGTYTRYSVGAQNQLSEGPRVSFRNLGGTGTVMTRFVAPNLAYSLTRDELELIVWDPEAMLIRGSVSAANIADAEYPDLDYGEAVSFGDYVAWPIQWADWKSERFRPEVGVVLASTRSLEPPIVLRDGRCGAGWMLYVDDAGDLHATGTAMSGYAHFFGAQAGQFPSDCVLRINAGSLEFDPDYRVDLQALTGSPAIYQPWHMNDDALVAAVWDPLDDPAAVSPDDYWTKPMLRQLVRVEQGRSTRLEGMPKSSVWSALSQRIDDTLYLLAVEGRAFEGAGPHSELYRVTDTGAELALSTNGFLWSVGRVR